MHGGTSFTLHSEMKSKLQTLSSLPPFSSENLFPCERYQTLNQSLMLSSSRCICVQYTPFPMKTVSWIPGLSSSILLPEAHDSYLPGSNAAKCIHTQFSLLAGWAAGTSARYRISPGILQFKLQPTSSERARKLTSNLVCVSGR